MGKISDFVDQNPTLVLGGGVVLALLIGSQLIKGKTATSNATGTPNLQGGDLSGLTTNSNGQSVVYVPTQTTFSTTNQKYGAFSNDPNLTTITGPIAVSSPTNTTTSTTTKTVNPPPVVITPPIIINPSPKPPVTPPSPPPSSGSAGTGNPPPRAPSPPQPAPPPTTYHLYWDQRYTIVGGDTLSRIAANRTAWLRANKNFPGQISWSDIYAHNTTVINADSAAHNNPIPGGPWNDIFPGEVIVIPDWRSP